MHILGEEGFQIERIISTQKVKKHVLRYISSPKKKTRSTIWYMK